MDPRIHSRSPSRCPRQPFTSWVPPPRPMQRCQRACPGEKQRNQRIRTGLYRRWKAGGKRRESDVSACCVLGGTGTAACGTTYLLLSSALALPCPASPPMSGPGSAGSEQADTTVRKLTVHLLPQVVGGRLQQLWPVGLTPEELPHVTSPNPPFVGESFWLFIR
eukprot:1761149-Rhodomonas_salina.1